MSHNQSRTKRTEYRKTGRSGSFQQRSFSSGGGGKGSAGASAPSLSSNQSRSFKKYNNNAQGGQYRASGPTVNSDTNNQITPGAVQNGTHTQQPSPWVSDASVTSAPVKPNDVSAPKTTQAVPKAPTSNVSAPSSETTGPGTPAKADASRSFPLQFGSVSPGCMDGMHIPARTSSSPPNIDEQKRDQAWHQISRAGPALPTLSIPKQLPEKDGGTADHSNTGEAHSKSKRDNQVSAMPLGTQTQKPSVHPMPGMPVQMHFHQPLVALQFGGPNPQIQSQPISVTSMPMPMPMPLPIGNPPLQQPVFVPGLQPHQMQPQGLIHQGQGLNFSSPMGPQMPSQLGNIGIFPQQQAGKFGSPRKVKITHPDTHEELRFDGSSGPSSILVRAPRFLPGNGSQINPSSPPPKSYNQVTVKSAGSSDGEKDTLSSTCSPVVASKYSKLQGEDPVHLQKHSETPSQSFLHDKSTLEPNVTKNAVPRRKKKRKESIKKANATNATSDLYMAFKGSETPSQSSLHEKSTLEPNVTRNAVSKGKKKRKELIRKAKAADATSDLYMAYKGPGDKKEIPTSVESTINTSSKNLKQISRDVVLKDDVPSAWEDVVDIISSKLEPRQNEDQVNGGFNNRDDGKGLTVKKYSRDFLLKFAEQCNELLEGFEFTSDIPDILMVSNAKVSRDSYPSSGRVIDRPIRGPRPDCRGNGIGDEEKWSKLPGPLVTGRDVRMDIGVLRNPRAQMPVQYAGAILTVPMQPLGYQVGIQRNNSDFERWAPATTFQKGLLISPQTPQQMMHRAKNKYQIGKVADEEEAKQRQLKAILNKLTPQNFEKLFEQVRQVNIDNVVTLTGLISQIFDKALMEPTFCEMYANFCRHLAAELPDLSVDNKKNTFKRLLLNKCLVEFERGEKEEEEANKADEEGEVKQLEEERDEKRHRVRRRMSGNIRLIGELYKKKMLTERIMHECIKKLLGGPGQIPDEEDIEALCKLMSTIGEVYHPKAKVHMDAYFDMMAKLSTNTKLSSRVRFMLLDSIDLRKNKWRQRRKVEGPEKIEEVHRDAAQERQAQASRLTHSPSITNSVRRGQPMDYAPRGSNVFSSPSSQLGGMRSLPPQLRGFGAQDTRFEDTHPLDSRTPSVPLPQRSFVDDSITLGPQGGLGRGMSFRGSPSVTSGPLTDVTSPGDSRRTTDGLNSSDSILEWNAYGPREKMMPRYMPERFASPSIYEQSSLQEQSMNHGNRDMRNEDCSFDRTLLTSPPARGGGPTLPHSTSSEKVWPEKSLRDMSMGAIKEFYSAKDENEVVLCIKELNAPSFYPSIISLWVADSFERKDMERDLLSKLLVNLSKYPDRMISQDQLIKGFESVLMTLEDAVYDAPKAAEFLGRMLGKVVSENVISLAEIGKLIFEGGEEQGCLVEIGLATEVVGSILENIVFEKGKTDVEYIEYVEYVPSVLEDVVQENHPNT